MNKILDVLLAGLGMAVVGKICYDFGKEVGDSLAMEKAKALYSQQVCIPFTPDEVKEQEKETIKRKIQEKLHILKNTKDIAVGLTSKNVFGQLLKNPDGTRIEAEVVDGTIQISVKPKN